MILYGTVQPRMASFVQMSTHGTHPYCNTNPSQYDIPQLPQSDQSIVKQLHQLQIFTRHGARTTDSSLYDYFGEDLVSQYNMQFDCNITTLETRDYVDNNNYITFRKNFQNNQQIVDGNCLKGQSLYPLLFQHKINGQKIFNHYIDHDTTETFFASSNNQTIFNASQLLTIFEEILNQQYSSKFQIHCTNYERTLSSAMALVTSMFDQLLNQSNFDCIENINSTSMMNECYQLLDELSSINLNLENENHTNIVWDVVTHDKESSPYLPRENYIFGDDLKTYMNQILENNDYYDYYQSDEITEIYQQYANITNLSVSSISSKIGIDILPAYCDNIKIPLTSSLFDKIVNASYHLKQLYWQNEYNMYENQRQFEPNASRHEVFQLASSPMRNIIYDYAVQINDSQKIVYHSFHDSTILVLLGGLGISNGIQPIFAELLLLEIFEIKNNASENVNDFFPSGFGFRFLRNGDILQFENCSSLIEIGSQLCDLNVLLTILSQNAMTMTEWQQFVPSYLNEVITNNNDTDDTDAYHTTDTDCNDSDDSDTKKQYTERDLHHKWLKGFYLGLGLFMGISLAIFAIYSVLHSWGYRFRIGRHVGRKLDDTDLETNLVEDQQL